MVAQPLLPLAAPTTANQLLSYVRSPGDTPPGLARRARSPPHSTGYGSCGRSSAAASPEPAGALSLKDGTQALGLRGGRVTRESIIERDLGHRPEPVDVVDRGADCLVPVGRGREEPVVAVGDGSPERVRRGGDADRPDGGGLEVLELRLAVRELVVLQGTMFSSTSPMSTWRFRKSWSGTRSTRF